jgi:putative aldouronate transport system substrate-binding protein
MKKAKRIISVVVSLVLLTALFAGCGPTTGPATEATTASTQTATASSAASTEATAEANSTAEHLELSVAIWGIQDGFDDSGAKDDTIFNNLQTKLNVTVKPVQITWSDWSDKLKMWAAADQLPDIFANNLVTDNPGLYNTWATQNVIKALPDDLSKYPNIAKVMELPSVTPFKINGKYYMYPRMSFQSDIQWALDRAVLYRKDWAQQAGFTSDPKSFDDFVAMFKAVQKAHPNTIGLVVNNPIFLYSTMTLGSFPQASLQNAWVKEDGKWIPSYASKNMYDCVKQLRTIYTEGILDKDFGIANTGGATAIDKFTSGQSFACFGGLQQFNVEKFVAANQVKIEDAVGFMEMYPAADGKRYTFTTQPYWSETFFRSNLEDNKLDRALQLLDYMSSDEYITQVKNGIEGTDYKLDNGKAVSLLGADQSLAKKYPITNVIGSLGSWGNYFPYTGKQVVSANPNQAAYDQLRIDAINRFQTDCVPSPVNYDATFIFTDAKNKIGPLNDQVCNVDMVKMILGKEDPVKMWQDIIKSYDAKGLQEAITEVNAEAQKMGLE